MSLPSYSVEDMTALQGVDTVLWEVLGFGERGTFLSGEELSKPALVLLHRWDRLVK